MNKDIYIIKNNINNKVYIGQSNNPKQRFQEHCKKKKKDIYFDKIIHKYGKEHFWFEILEQNVHNYNEREQYWIKYYNSLVPNGYNISLGGNQISEQNKGINVINSAIKSEELLFQIIDDIQNSTLTLLEISKKYNINKNTVSKINCGRTYKLDLFEYPLRPLHQGKKVLTQQQEQEIKNLIINSTLTFQEIAEKYQILPGLITKINCGICYYDIETNYPLRKSHITKKHLTEEQLNNIYDKLENSAKSLRTIAQ